MTKLVPAANRSAALPFESLEVFLADAKTLAALRRSGSVEEVERGMQHASDLARKIEAAKRPIGTSELATELATIVAAFPHGKAAEDFAAVLLASVAVMRPSVGAVKLAARQLIFTAKFLPAVAEVRAAIEEQAGRLRDIEWDVGQLPKHLAYLKEVQRLADKEKREREERIEKHRLEMAVMRSSCDEDEIPF
jgi:hypothetical protein